MCVLNLNESTFAVHFRVRHKIRGLLTFNVPEKNKSSAALRDGSLDHSLAPMSFCCTDQKIITFFQPPFCCCCCC